MLHRAVLRDLDRLTSVLAGPVTAVRRAALIGHVTFLTGELRRHWQLQDELIWPRAVAGDPSLAGAADQVRGDHRRRGRAVRGDGDGRASSGPGSATPSTDCWYWTRCARWPPCWPAVFERDGDVTALALGALTSQDWAAIDRGVARRRRPTATLARELFWLLDELDAASAAVLLADVPPLRMWVLRNGFSGGYNRGSYLMWVGGGLGVPV